VPVGRRDLFLLKKTKDPKKPWKRYDIGTFAKPPQSVMRTADSNGDTRPDIVSGLFWIECPSNPRT